MINIGKFKQILYCWGKISEKEKRYYSITWAKCFVWPNSHDRCFLLCISNFSQLHAYFSLFLKYIKIVKFNIFNHIIFILMVQALYSYVIVEFIFYNLNSIPNNIVCNSIYVNIWHYQISIEISIFWKIIFWLILTL